MDLLGIWYEKGVSLIATDGIKIEKIAEGKAFGIDSKQYWEPYIFNSDKLIVVIDETVYIFTQNGLASHITHKALAINMSGNSYQ